MPDRRGFRMDFIACAWLFLGLLVALSVFSFGPAEKEIVSPAAADNLMGPAGFWVARTLHRSLGLTVYLFLASWFVSVVVLFLRRSYMTWFLRLTGWLILVPCAAYGVEALGLNTLGNNLHGGGGSLGEWLVAWLETRFYPIGRVVIFSGFLLLGLVLSIDFAFDHLFLGIGGSGKWLWSKAPRPALSRPRKQIVEPVEAPLPPEKKATPVETPLVSPVSNPDEIPINHPKPVETIVAPSAKVVVPTPIVRPRPVSEDERFADFELPSLTLLEDPQPFPYEEHDQRLRERAALLEKTFTDFELNVKVVGINTGPVITQFEVALETGLRVHKVTRLSDDLALNLKVSSVRIVTPIPGKNTVGVEIPNEHRAVVRLKEVILTAGKKVSQLKIPLFLGKDTEGRALVYDLAEMPHLLIAGRTGTGKSVCMNAIILSMLMTRRPDEIKMIMIDPKMLEMSEYGKIPHLMHPVVKDMKKAEAILSWAVDKMEERYDLLSRARVRNIAGYNDLSRDEVLRRVEPADDDEAAKIPVRMPYIVIFVDEMNDLMMTMKKEVEGHIIRLAQKSRAAGIHLVVATQKPTVDVITGLIKSNLPARICFQVSSRSDSRVVLDEMGADKLLGKGDMLFLQPGTSTLLRSQGTYASDEEITRVVECLKCEPCYAQELVQLSASNSKEGGSVKENLRARDDLYEQAIEIVLREGRGSVSLLQRALGIGYGRAARLVDFMAGDGIVGDYKGSHAREVLFTPEEWANYKNAG